MRLILILIFASFFTLIGPALGDLNSDVIVEGLNNPWEIVFAPEGEIYFTE